MFTAMATVIVVLAGLYLIGLGAFLVFWPSRSSRFLDAFASSASAHLLEVAIRLLVGAAMVGASPRMRFATVFEVFGWVLVITSIGLAIIPWRWHRKFAHNVVPIASQHRLTFALSSSLLGAWVIWSSLGGGPPTP